ncbi:MAG: MerR family transcriptional regulator [Kofleriaceae bacterium]|nr:MerR family transcriptional regulator [Kofleriaceae bacterium]
MTNSLDKIPKRLQVGEFAKTVGKTVRALHLYEELGLLKPVGRSKGGFRLYDAQSAERAKWIVKLQGIGFTLAQIQGFVADLEGSHTGSSATVKARDVFENKLVELRQQISKLQGCESDLVDALNYLEGCAKCESDFTPENCQRCDQNGHEPGRVPELFSGMTENCDEGATTTNTYVQPTALGSEG